MYTQCLSLSLYVYVCVYIYIYIYVHIFDAICIIYSGGGLFGGKALELPQVQGVFSPIKLRP